MRGSSASRPKTPALFVLALGFEIAEDFVIVVRNLEDLSAEISGHTTGKMQRFATQIGETVVAPLNKITLGDLRLQTSDHAGLVSTVDYKRDDDTDHDQETSCLHLLSFRALARDLVTSDMVMACAAMSNGQSKHRSNEAADEDPEKYSRIHGSLKSIYM